MTEFALRAKVVAVAKSLVGRKESDGSHKELVDRYNETKPLPRNYKVIYTDAWCALFVSVVGILAELTDIIFRECGCGQMIKLYKKAGRWKENDGYTPQPGDIIMYDWQDSGKGDCTGWPDHVGIVEKVAGGVIHVIEGNYNNAVKIRKIAVNARYIRGYCLPDYASLEIKEPTAVPSPAPEANDVDITYQVFAGGRWLPAVKNLEDYAGIEGEPITGLAVCSVSAGRLKYQVHAKGRGWLGQIWASDYNLSDFQKGFAGNLVHEIDAIRAFYYTPEGITPYKEVMYRVDTVDRKKYYAWQSDMDTDDGQDGYAGVLGGKSIDRVQMCIQ